VLSVLFKVSSLLLLAFPIYGGNSIYITQVGTSDNLTLDILQDGDDNEVRLSISHDNNSIDIDQEGNNNTVSWVSYWGSGQAWGGDLDGSGNTLKFEQYNTTGTDTNRIGFHINTNDNNVHVCQGKTFVDENDATCESSATAEYGGHTINIDLHSGDTDLKGSQETGTGNADHEARIYTYGGDNNDIFFKQKGNGNKTLYFTVRTDNGEQSMVQKGDGVHTATIDLTGAYTTDLDLVQNSNSNQSYTLTNNCQTATGCAISVTQN
tara:strand:+ start:221 stop:1015 length:795 start_codon:yes stop_codon:yes gene_type:complete